ncbi:rhomboid family intramembrane serine protease [Candidatus Poribacteria bacterium]|nr:rhomboid family intramembrane serine protease [Candidatus Poribacteria bacterium]
MIPIKDTVPSKTYPFVTIGLIVINSIVFLFEVSLGEDLNQFLMTFGLIPLRFFHQIEVGKYPIRRFIPFFTSMFLHGGWLHLIGNMWYLWIFGDNVEDRMGHLKYILFYVLCGLAAGTTHLFTNVNSGIPTVGASGAIAGVMGAYIVLYPKAKIWTLIPIFLFIQFIEIPAFLFLGFWILMQFLIGTFSRSVGPSQGGVAWWAHIGGFAAGAILVFLFKKRKKHEVRRYADEYHPW